jgi:hypothetical protein
MLALLVADVLAGCSAVLLEAPAEPAAPTNYGFLVATTLRPFPDFATYSNFEIAAPRWVHADTGWNWLTCVRFQDHGRRKLYSVFIRNGAVTDSRFDILTDHCAAQQYMPFDRVTGAIGVPLSQTPQPQIYYGLPPTQPPPPTPSMQPTLQPQQPIY